MNVLGAVASLLFLVEIRILYGDHQAKVIHLLEKEKKYTKYCIKEILNFEPEYVLLHNIQIFICSFNYLLWTY